MNKKIEKSYIYTGLGFPIELINVEMTLVDDEYLPKIDIQKVADLAIESLVSQNKRFTGNNIKFIRTYFAMSLRDFAKVVNESHMAVKKWEDFKSSSTNMDRNIEIMLRLFIYNKIYIKDRLHINKDTQKKKIINFYEQYLVLTEMFSSVFSDAKNLQLDLKHKITGSRKYISSKSNVVREKRR